MSGGMQETQLSPFMGANAINDFQDGEARALVKILI